MASYALLQTHNDLDAMIRIFNEVILTTPSSGDAQAMHSTIIAMVSNRLKSASARYSDVSRTERHSSLLSRRSKFTHTTNVPCTLA